MPLATLRTVLVNAAPVVALVPALRIEPDRRTQSYALPAIVLQVVSTVPYNHLRGSGLNLSLIQLDVYASDYTSARNIADASRAALEPSFTLQSQIDGGFEPETDPELFRITQTWSVYT